MKTSLDCMECNVKQLIKVSKLLNVSEKQQEKASKRLFLMLSNISFEHTNPHIMGKMWEIMTSEYGNDNPYKEIKHMYNELILDMYDAIAKIISESNDPFNSALKIAVTGNIIDFGARHQFSKEELLQRILNHDSIKFKVNDTEVLRKKLQSAKTLLYIGDNCGEIVLDKLFIQTIKQFNPTIRIYFGVRGGNILNDVTKEDAVQVQMQEVAEVISSGISVPGTIIEESSNEFQKVFTECDVIIAKGQGNYESLSDTKREHLYLMLLAKCEYVANTIGVQTMDYVVLHNK